MSLSEAKLREDLKLAMRERDELRTRVVRGLLAAIKNKSIEARGEELSESDLVAIVKKEAKQCSETLAFARDAGRTESVTEHEAVLAVLETYLPQQLGEEQLRAEIAAIISDTEAEGMGAMGQVMKELGARHAGRYDGKLASGLVRKMLGS
jgi:uncharacterized protein YqeY